MAMSADADADADVHGDEQPDGNPRGHHRDDPMGPPKEPCECWCMHCRRTFMSSAMWFQRIIGDPHGLDGFWMCPTPNCGGAGFTFDIFPTDPDHPANQGWYEDDEEEEFQEDDDDDESIAFAPDGDVPEWSEAHVDHAADWDPDETKWKQLDEDFGDDPDDDLEGEEWKHGLQPGERPPEPDWAAEARREREEQERKYDEPDQRPRELDWSDRADRPPRGGWSEDDIPF
jgi:hypothetical protein